MEEFNSLIYDNILMKDCSIQQDKQLSANYLSKYCLVFKNFATTAVFYFPITHASKTEIIVSHILSVNIDNYNTVMR